MLKYYKQFFSDYEYADTLQSLSIVLFVIFFLSVTLYVFSRPKKYYDEASHLPLDDDEETLKK